MPIPLSQLETWSKQGPIDSSSRTYASIKNALVAHTSPISTMVSSGSVNVYLQGSYRNDTNTRGDSDVDVIVEYEGAFYSNKESLPPDQFAIHEELHSSASYTWHSFRQDIIVGLTKYYGEDFVDAKGNKSLKVLPNSNRLRADVVPVISYRNYDYFNSLADYSHVPGVAFHHKSTDRLIVNFPKKHYENGVKKHGDTDEQFKKIVRIAKNARARIVDAGLIDKSKAPSYFLQSLFFNVPDPYFKLRDLDDIFPAVLNFLNNHNFSGFMCQNDITHLFGTTEEDWNISDARYTVNALIYLWNNWYQ